MGIRGPLAARLSWCSEGCELFDGGSKVAAEVRAFEIVVGAEGDVTDRFACAGEDAVGVG